MRNRAMANLTLLNAGPQSLVPRRNL
jgi:hypothetical protein